MTNVFIDDKNMTDIGNAIREKLSVADQYLPSEMAQAIKSITSGSGGSNSIERGTLTSGSRVSIARYLFHTDYLNLKPTYQNGILIARTNHPSDYSVNGTIVATFLYSDTGYKFITLHGARNNQENSGAFISNKDWKNIPEGNAFNGYIEVGDKINITEAELPKNIVDSIFEFKEVTL